jgi:hypothetical protein
MNINKVLCTPLLTLCLFFASVIDLRATQESLIRQSSNKQVTPVQPKDDFTVTIVQTGPPSPEMLNRIPVKMTITNNTDRAFILRLPYLFNISSCTADNSKFVKKILAYGTGIAAKDMVVTTGGVFLVTEACAWLVAALCYCPYFAHIPFSFAKHKQIAKFALYCGIAIGAFSEALTIIHALLVNAEYMIEPHKPITIQGYIHQMVLEPIQSGRIIPYSIAIDLENCEDEMMKNLYKIYKAASKPQTKY